MPVLLVHVPVAAAGEPNPRPINDDTRAVAAGPYVMLDEGQGGITRGEIREEDIRPLGSFELGQEVFAEATDAEDVLDDTDEATARETRIWWRATIIGAVEVLGAEDVN